MIDLAPLPRPSIFLDVNHGTGQPTTWKNHEHGIGQKNPGAKESPDGPPEKECHPLLLKYPFDPQGAPEGSTVPRDPHDPTTEPAVLPAQRMGPAATQFLEPDDLGPIDSSDLPEETANAPYQPGLRRNTGNPHGLPARRRRSIHRPYRQRHGLMHLLARHGLLLTFVSACHLFSAYQLARVYQHVARTAGGALTLTPAIFLLECHLTFFFLLIVRKKRPETIAIALLILGGLSIASGLASSVMFAIWGGN